MLIFISSYCHEEFGTPSDWLDYLNDPSPDYYDDFSLEELPWFLGNAFSEIELKHIAKELLLTKAGELRVRLPKDKRFKGTVDGAAEQIVNRLNHAQTLQTILLAENTDIIKCIEKLIDERRIIIPETETRNPPIGRSILNWLDIECECSQFGVRAVPQRRSISLARLKRLVDEVFQEERDTKELAWKLRHVGGDSTRAKLDTYLHASPPKEIVSNLLFSSPVHLQKTFSALRYGAFNMPVTTAEEDRMVEKILWKLGFDIPIFPAYQRLFWERLERFLDVARTGRSYEERDRETIRSAAVNFFVSLEETLDYSLSFSTWLLLQDHYGLTRFKCNFDSAREFMAEHLSGRRKTTEGTIEFERTGKNTLYPLIQGFSILTELCTELLSTPTQWQRPAQEMPGYYTQTSLFKFPFLYKLELLNLSDGDRSALLRDLIEVTQRLDAANVCAVRNRIEHKRADFPSQMEIEQACTAIKDVMVRLESSGLMPTVFFFSESKNDTYGRSIITLKDYRGRAIEAFYPSAFEHSGLPSFGRGSALLVTPKAHISGSAEYLRFSFEEKSEFTKIWQDYPRRRMASPTFSERPTPAENN